MSVVPDDVARTILGFCDPDRYLTTGVVSKSLNEAYGKNRTTCVVGFLESVSNPDEWTGPVPLGEDTLEVLARSKDRHRLIPRALAMGLEWDHFCVEKEAERGNRDFFLWLSTTDLFWLPENAYASAARAGRVDMMDFFLERGFGYPDARCDVLCSKSDSSAELRRWVEETESTGGYRLAEGVKNDDLRAVMAEINEDTEYEWMLQDAVRCGSISVVGYLVEDAGLGPSPRDVNTAVGMDRREILELLLPAVREPTPGPRASSR